MVVAHKPRNRRRGTEGTVAAEDRKLIRKLRDECKELRASRRVDEAVQKIKAALEDHPDNFLLRLELARTLSASNTNHDETVEAWLWCIDNHADKIEFNWLRKLRAAAQHQYHPNQSPEEANRWREVIARVHELAEACRGTFPDKAGSGLTEDALAEWISEWEMRHVFHGQDLSDAIARIEDHFERFPGSKSAAIYTNYMRALVCDDPARFKERMQSVLDRARGVWPLAALKRQNRGRRTRNEIARFWLSVADFQIRNGQTDEALATLGQVSADDASAGLVGDLTRLATALRADLDGSGQGSNAMPDCTFGQNIAQWSPDMPSSCVLIVFLSNEEKSYLGNQPLHALLSKLCCHIVYVKEDISRFFLEGETWNHPADLTAQLREIATDLKATRVCTFGVSVAGYAAMFHGAGISADGVLAISPIVHPARVPWGPARTLLEDKSTALPDVEFDLTRIYQAEGTPPETVIALDGGCDKDSSTAADMAKFDNVALVFASSKFGGGAVKGLLMEGRLMPLLRSLVTSNNTEALRPTTPEQLPTG